MNIETNSNPPTTGAGAGLPGPRVKLNAEPVKLSKMPGLIAISLYMILLAGVAVVYVVQGRVGALFLILPVLFIAGARSG